MDPCGLQILLKPKYTPTELNTVQRENQQLAHGKLLNPMVGLLTANNLLKWQSLLQSKDVWEAPKKVSPGG